MSYNVMLTNSATKDLEELYAYIVSIDSEKKAAYVLDKIEEVIGHLSTNPERGTFLKELLELGIKEYREVFFKPYRLIYRVIGKRVYIYMIVDGRRDMQSLLERRLFDK